MSSRWPVGCAYVAATTIVASVTRAFVRQIPPWAWRERLAPERILPNDYRTTMLTAGVHAGNALHLQNNAKMNL